MFELQCYNMKKCVDILWTEIKRVGTVESGDGNEESRRTVQPMLVPPPP